MRRPVLLDLFCGAGGASKGYHDAGFVVVGVDINPQPNYPFEFHQANALSYDFGPSVKAVHASPPCQGYSVTARLHPERNYPKLIEPTRRRLESAGVPYVIENVPGAPLVEPIQLCGTMFGLTTRRHRIFETSWRMFSLMQPCVDHADAPVQVFGHGGDSSRYWSMDDWRQAMGIDWMNREEMAEAIPPAYTEFIGASLLQQMAVVS